MPRKIHPDNDLAASGRRVVCQDGLIGEFVGRIVLWKRVVGGLLAIVVTVAVVGSRVIRGMVWDAMLPRTLPTPAIPEGLRSLSAAECGSCHVEIHAEWRASRMGRSMQNTAFLADWSANEHMPICLNCHAPFQAQQPRVITGIESVLPTLTFEATQNQHFDPALQQEGVTCLACHATQEGAVAAVHGNASAPHALAVEPRLTSGEVCIRCHQMVTSPLFDLARPVIDTVAEHAEWRALTGRPETCVDCHMTAVERATVPGMTPRSGRRHDFHGGWNDETLRAAIELGEVRREGASIMVEVTNRAGHRFPTGETSGAVVVEFIALDEFGVSLGHATERITREVEGPRFHDVLDTTFLPDETRILRADLSPGIVQSAEGARVVFRYERYANLPTVREHASRDGLSTTVEFATFESRFSRQ